MYEHPLGFSCEDMDDRCGDLEVALAEAKRVGVSDLSIVGLINEANDRVRHPIDLNYVAIPKDTWERIVGLVNRV